jgi:hypothetical protein
MYNLEYAEGASDLKFVDKLSNLLNEVNEKTGATFNSKQMALKGVNVELANPISGYKGLKLNYPLNVPSNKFSIRSRPVGGLLYTNLVISELLEVSDKFVNGTYTYIEQSTLLQCKLSFQNVLHRPIDFDTTLTASTNKTLRFNSWHLQEVNDFEGNTKFELVRLASESIAMQVSGADNGSILSSRFKSVNVNGKPMLLLALPAVKKDVMSVTSSDSEETLKNLSLKNIASFDFEGNALPQWPAVDVNNLVLNDELMQEDNDPDMENTYNNNMMSILVKNKDTFDKYLNRNKSSIQAPKSYRVILQDLLQQFDHEGNMALRVDPAGGVHTNELNSAKLTISYPNLFGSATGIQQSGN